MWRLHITRRQDDICAWILIRGKWMFAIATPSLSFESQNQYHDSSSTVFIIFERVSDPREDSSDLTILVGEEWKLFRLEKVWGHVHVLAHIVCTYHHPNTLLTSRMPSGNYDVFCELMISRVSRWEDASITVSTTANICTPVNLLNAFLCSWVPMISIKSQRKWYTKKN